jgi:hypothetical protein
MLAQLSAPENQRRMLFVVGAARSGTTALQTALNASDDVFLLGEANFFRENLKRGFRARYNARHQVFGFPPSKQNDCPAVAPERGAWVETVAGLLAQHRLVGETIAFGAFEPGQWVSEFLAFQRRYFPAAAYILAFRNPRDAILSPATTWGVQELMPWAKSYIEATRGLIRLRRDFPRTVPVFLETIEPATVLAIERCLDCPMPQFSALMFSQAASPPDPARIPAELRETMTELDLLYPVLREAAVSVEGSGSGSALAAIDAELAAVQRGLDAKRLIRRPNLALGLMRPATVATLGRLSEPANQRRMLFVVGGPYSGTAGLQAALNASADVFLLDEANFFREDLKRGFRARYNARHRSGSASSKQNDCPALVPENSTWVESVAALLAQHRLVGEKVAFGPVEPERQLSEFLEFHQRYFRSAAYILAFRNPRDTILSSPDTWGAQELAPWAASWIVAMRGLVRLRRHFPRTVPVFLETFGPAAIQAIERCLDCPMPQLSALTLAEAERAPDPGRIPAELREVMAELDRLYPVLREAVDSFVESDSGAVLDAIDAELAGVQRRLDARQLIRRADRVFRATRTATVATLARLSASENQRRMLFVVGAARSGTTALQTALNAGADVFLLGEANFFREGLRPGFRARYNERHRLLAHPPGKQNNCPAVAPENGTWVETLAGLLAQHRLVGEKVAFGAFEPDQWVSEFLAFQRRYFPAAAYILAFRNPRDAILSSATTWGVQELTPWARSYIEATRGLIRLRRDFPRTVPVFLETIEPATVLAIERCLDYPMPQFSALMFSRVASPPDPGRIPAELRETMTELDGLYPVLRVAVESFVGSGSSAALDAINAELAALQRGLCRLR